MASTPFTPNSVAYPGLRPPRDHSYTAAARRFWLGRAGAMNQLPSPALGYDVAISQGETVHKLGNGRTAVRFLPDESREWSLKFPKLYGGDLEVVHGFYRRLFGLGPWCFLPPDEVNRLTLAQSLTGNLNDVAEGWTVDAGTITYDPSITAAILPAGVLRWSPPGAAGNLARIGHDTTLGVDLTKAVPYIAAEPYTASVYAAKASGTLSARIRLLAIAADGITVSGYGVGPTVALTTSLSLLTATVNAGALGNAAYIVPAVENLTASAPDMLLSAVQLQLGSTATNWAAGRGTPRVVWATSPSASIGSLFASDFTMVLSES
jgi:hypothetical protein